MKSMIARASQRAFTSEAKKAPLNMIQQMKEYQEALQFAVDKRYPESLGKLEEAVKVVEQTTGTHYTPYHLFLFQRIASI